MIRSSKATLKFANDGKQEQLRIFTAEYRRIVEIFVNEIWDLEKLPSLLPKELTDKVETWLSARMIQCAGKQASGIVRGTKTKQKRRQFIINKLNEEGKFKQARRLQRTYEKFFAGKPAISNVEPELDERFIQIQFEGETSFDGWITIGSIGNKMKLIIPFNKHKHFNEMFAKGKLKKGIRISNKSVTFMFELEDPKPIAEGKILGIDIGQKTTLACSDGQEIDIDVHGHNYQSICKKLARKKKDSIGFHKAQTHRTNYINWCINQLNLDGVRQVNRENIKNLRMGRRNRRMMQHWNYGELFDKLDIRLEELGVLVSKFNPTYTSQRCSSCGWVRKGNRKKKLFKCDKCGHTQDADLNASLNLSLSLMPIGKKERLLHKNRTGFYWNVIGQEPIVPVAQKPIIENFQ